ncbi:MAG TPA: FeoA family protein [Trueperaceae bacterium]|nr:FeoA family protein [Trueperaceae bacterium]
MKPDRPTRDYRADATTPERTPLAALHHGDLARVTHVEGGRAVSRRMRMVGIRPGVDVRILHGPDRKGAVIGVGTARIALGRAVLDIIHVAPAGTSDHGR